MHQVIQSLTIPRFLHSFASSDRFVAICTTSPASVDALSSASFTTIHIIASPSLALFPHPAQLNTNHVSVSDIDTSAVTTTNTTTITTCSQPHPIDSLLRHLLAFALRLHRDWTRRYRQLRNLHHHRIIIIRPPLLQPLSVYPQADLGNAAMMVGGTGLKPLLGVISFLLYMGASYKNNVNTYLRTSRAIFNPSVVVICPLAPPLRLA